MDVYHKVLARLLEATGGRESEKVDIKELVKKEGFLSSYPDIFQHLSRQSWIAETPRPDVVRITHWGITEAKKSTGSGADSGQAAKRETTRVISEARELISILEAMSDDLTSEGIAKAEKSAESIAAGICKLKESV